MEKPWCKPLEMFVIHSQMHSWLRDSLFWETPNTHNGRAHIPCKILEIQKLAKATPSPQKFSLVGQVDIRIKITIHALIQRYPLSVVWAQRIRHPVAWQCPGRLQREGDWAGDWEVGRGWPGEDFPLCKGQHGAWAWRVWGQTDSNLGCVRENGREKVRMIGWFQLYKALPAELKA